MWSLWSRTREGTKDGWFELVGTMLRCPATDSPWCRGLITIRVDIRTGGCVYAEESGGGEVEDGPTFTLRHRIPLHPRGITGVQGKIS